MRGGEREPVDNSKGSERESISREGEERAKRARNDDIVEGRMAVEAEN